MTGRVFERHLGYQLYTPVLLLTPNNSRCTSPIIVTVQVSRKFLLVMVVSGTVSLEKQSFSNFIVHMNQMVSLKDYSWSQALILHF